VKSYSITHRLITTILLVELLAALAISGAAMLYERHVRFRSFDVMLRGRADSLLGAVQDAEDTQDNVMLDGTQVNFPAEDIYQVQDAGGRVLGHSANWNGPDTAMLGAKTDKHLRLSINGKHYRALRIEGLRIVDPGDKGGGIPRRVRIVDLLAFESRPRPFAPAGGGGRRGLGQLLELRSSATGADDQRACTAHDRAGDGDYRSGAGFYAAAPLCQRCRA
jgi:hypothetical protein